MDFLSYILQPRAWTEHWGWALPLAQPSPIFLSSFLPFLYLVRSCASTPGRM